MNQILTKTIESQKAQQDSFTNQKRKDNGIFFTNELAIIDSILDVIKFDKDIVNKKIFEPACGNGVFLIRILEKIYDLYPSKETIKYFVENNLYFLDIDPVMVETTKKNVGDLYKNFFSEEYDGNFNGFTYDFTEKVINEFDLFSKVKNPELKNLLGNIDYIVGNPPYVTLYGRRDRKINEQQRINYLEQYKQFPKSVKNGKINYVMLFLEHGLDYLKKEGKLSYIIDISFFETAYQHTRKYILEKTKILSLEKNISNFDGVASGQLILKLEKNNENKNHFTTVKDFVKGELGQIEQNNWYQENDEYKFRVKFSDESDLIINKINRVSPRTLKDQYPNKALRTCAMLLDMEEQFLNLKTDPKDRYYKYYQGSKALYNKYCELFSDKFFRYDKPLQDNINNKLKIELTKKGIKNKKRIGLGDPVVYDNPKVFIRQSAKEIIASYDENLSASNNSLYVFSLWKNDNKTRQYLKFLCGYLNSELVTFYAQQMEIVRYTKGKQPQIKISDLYSIPVPQDVQLIEKISGIVDQIYSGLNEKKQLVDKINQAIYNFYNISLEEIKFVEKSISNFLKS